MATESPIRIIETSGNWPSHNDSVRFRPPSGNMAIEDLGLLLNGHRFQGNSGRDLIPNRSGSAPPNMEGSFAAIENLISQQQYQNSELNLNFGSLNINPTLSEEQLRADPAYVAYYWSNVNLNPRLPPPLVSRENRGFVRYSNNGVRLTSFDDVSSSINSSLKIPVGNLPTHKEESEDDRSPQPVTDDWAEKNGGFWSGQVDESAASPAQLKSLVDLIQEDFPRTPSPVYTQTRSVSLESAEETVAYDAADSTSLQETAPIITSHDNIGQSSYSESSNPPNLSSTSSLDSTLDVKGVESAKNIPKTRNPEIPMKIQDRPQNIYHNNLINQQEQFHIQPNTTFQLPAVHPQMVSQGINQHQAYMTSPNQFLHGPTTNFPATEFQQQPQLLHQTYPMTSANIFHPNLQPSPYFSPQYNLAISPYMPAGYIPHSPVTVAYDHSVGPVFTSQPSSPGIDMHLNRFYNQLNYSMQPSYQDVNQRGVSVASNNPFYMGTPSNVGIFHQYPSSPIAASPRNEVRFPQSPVRTPVFGDWQGQRFDDSKNYSFLEELKSGKGRRFELSEIAGHIVDFSSDQHGSRFIQQKLEICNPDEKQAVFKEVLPHAPKLMTDVFGNYVIQKFFEYGTPEQRKELANQLEGHILPLSLQMYGCRVIQKALEVIELEQKCKLVHELDGHVLRCVRDQNGNHVIQKCIETIPTPRIDFIISSFREQVALLSTHPYGCRVIQRVLEHCTDEDQSQFIVDEILESVCSLAQDQYGNYVTQHVLERGKENERNQIISQLSGQFVQLSQHKFASNVVEKCLEYGDSSTREILIGEIIGPDEGQDNLLAMVKDQYANYVIQKILQTCTGSEREMLLSRIRIHLNSLKKYTYGKHIVARFEQLYGEELEMPVE